MGKKILILLSIICLVIVVSKFDIIELTNNSFSIHLSNFSNIFQSLASIPANLFNESVSLTTRIVDTVFSPEVLGLVFFGIVVLALANGN